MWQNFFQGTEAALAAALEHANFPQSEEEQNAVLESTEKGPSNDTNTETEIKDDKDDKDDKVATEDEKEPKKETSPKEISSSKETLKSWFDEDENAKEPSLDNWFTLPGISAPSTSSVVPSSMTSLLPTVVESLPSAVTNVFHSTNNTNGTADTQPQNTKHENDPKPAKSSGNELFESFQSTLSVFQKVAQEQLSEAQRIFHDDHHFSEPPRDISSPLDKKALQDAQVMYLTDRVIIMAHPMIGNSKFSPGQKVAAISHLLRKRHGNQYMIWNFSNIPYDQAIFQHQVLNAPLPAGGTQPSFSYLLHILVSIRKWLQESSDKSVAVFHCHQGTDGSMATILACFFSWLKEAGFHSPMEALEYIAQCHDISVETMTHPSQRRYLTYFQNLIQEDGGARPKTAPIILKRIVFSHVPKLDPTPNQESSENPILGCAPYIQIFKEGQLVQTCTGMANNDQDRSKQLKNSTYLPFFSSDNDDMTISFQMDMELCGDILFRCRHLSMSKKETEEEESSTSKKELVTIFRACFHTGFVETSKVLRFTKAQLDSLVPIENPKDGIPEDFHVDLIFDSYAGTMTASPEKGDDKTKNKPKDLAILPSKHDSIFYKESPFWEVLAKRRMMHSSKQEESSEVVLSGDTIGRRRVFSSSSKITMDDYSSSKSTSSTISSSSTQSTDALSINGFELVDVGGSIESIQEDMCSDIPHQEVQKGQYQEMKRNLEILLSGLDEEEQDVVVIGNDGNAMDDDEEDEEIIFDNGDDSHDGGVVEGEEEGKVLNLNLSLEEELESNLAINESLENNYMYEDDDALDDLNDFENFLKQM